MTERGPWKIKQSRDVYADPWIRVQVDDVVRPDGQPGIHSIIHIKPGICVLAIDAEGNVHLTEEFHYAVGRVTLEAVSGGIEPGEKPIDAAQRELGEELGIVAARWTDLGAIDPFTANVVSPTTLFLAEQLTFADMANEGTETIARVKAQLAEAMGWLAEGKITHAPTCVLLLRAHFAFV
jgi:ADP-ribose pyrophosphatase